MKYCPFCGNKLGDKMAFCNRCGKRYENADNYIEAEKTIRNMPNKYPYKKFISIVIFILIIAVLSVVAFFGFVLVNNTKRTMSSVEIADLSKSVLKIYSYDFYDSLDSTGSGFVLFDNSTIVTNYHVIEDSYRLEAVSENDIHYNISKVLYYDEERDVAILEFDQQTNIAPLIIAEPYQASVGETVYAIGSPLGLKNTISNGIISAVREENGLTDIQITAPISPGSSGGALLNEYGEVVGVTYASYMDGQNLNLAIPISDVLAIAQNGKNVMLISKLYQKTHPYSKYEQKYKDAISVTFEDLKTHPDLYNGKIVRINTYISSLNVYKGNALVSTTFYLSDLDNVSGNYELDESMYSSGGVDTPYKNVPVIRCGLGYDVEAARYLGGSEFVDDELCVGDNVVVIGTFSHVCVGDITYGLTCEIEVGYMNPTIIHKVQ